MNKKEDYRSPEGIEISTQAAKDHMQAIMADPIKRAKQIQAMQAGRQRTFVLQREKRERLKLRIKQVTEQVIKEEFSS